MEGYLLKKGRGESTFGRKNWKRRWFILEDQTLSYYEDFNLQSGTPGTFKGRTDVADCILVPSSDPNSFVFTIKHKKDGDLVLDAENEKAKNCKL